MNTTGTSEWTLGDRNVARYVETKSELNIAKVYYKVYIPNIMPNITEALAKDSIESISPSVFINSSECPVSCPAVITSQNYIKVPRDTRCTFKESRIKYGAQCEVVSKTQTLDTLTLMNTVDETTKGSTSENAAYRLWVQRDKGMVTTFGEHLNRER